MVVVLLISEQQRDHKLEADVVRVLLELSVLLSDPSSQVARGKSERNLAGPSFLQKDVGKSETILGRELCSDLHVIHPIFARTWHGRSGSERKGNVP